MPSAAHRRPPDAFAGEHAHGARLARRKTREVAAGRQHDHVKEIFVAGPHAQAGLGAEHGRADVKRAGIFGNPLALAIDQSLDAFDKSLFGVGRHRHARSRVHHAPGVHAGAEQNRRAIPGLVRLQPLENGLRVMQDDGGGVKIDRVPGLDAPALPLAIAIPGAVPQRRGVASEFQPRGVEVGARGRVREPVVGLSSKINLYIGFCYTPHSSRIA